MTINSGQAKLQTGTFKIIHIIETDKFQNLIDNLQESIYGNVSESHFLRPFLIHEITELQGYLDRLKPRARRSLNFIGSAWKWIAGNPDHDDFVILTGKTDQVLINNNKQVVINRLTLEKINELTRATNEIIKNVNYNDNIKEKLITKLKLKLDILKEEIVNIQYAIHWAKVGIVNSLILSSDEINIVKHIISKDIIPFVNIEQAFEFAEIKIASNGNSLVYIISLPTTENISCNKLLIRPIKFGKFVNKLLYRDVLICNKTIYGIKHSCKTYNNITICNEKNILNLDNDSCLANIIKSKPSNCSVIDNRKIPTIEEISPGTILLNQFNDTIYINTEPQRLTGTFIIQYHNASVMISEKTFNFFETTNLQPLPAILQPKLSNLNIEETLSLEMIKELQTNNTEAIDLLGTKHKWGLTINCGLSSMAFFVMIILLIKTGLFKKEKEFNVTPQVINSYQCPSVDLSMPEPSRRQETGSHGVQRISNIPYF